MEVVAVQHAGFDDFGVAACVNAHHSLWWFFAVALVCVVTTVAVVCFAAGWTLSKKWHEVVALALPPTRPRRVRHERYDHQTQCDRPSADEGGARRKTLSTARARHRTLSRMVGRKCVQKGYRALRELRCRVGQQSRSDALWERPPIAITLRAIDQPRSRIRRSVRCRISACVGSPSNELSRSHFVLVEVYPLRGEEVDSLNT